MDISVLQENLKQGLFTVNHIAGKNINLPILNNIMIRAKNGNIELISTNLEIGITYKIRGKIEEEGTYTVDSKIITDFVTLLSNQKINIKKSENELLVSCGNYKTKIKGQNSNEYPLIPTVDRKECYSVNANSFRESLSQVVFAVSKSESRIELSGVYFNFKDDKLTLVATDSYRLSEKEIKIKIDNKNKNEFKSVIVPLKTLQELIRILTGLKDSINIKSDDCCIDFYISDNQILFLIKSTQLVSRLIEGQYPDYKQIIPRKASTVAIVSKKELIRAIKVSVLFSKVNINDTRLKFKKNENIITVISASSNTGESNTRIESDIQGIDNDIVVNCNYLLDGLNNISDENIKIEIVNNNTPCVLKSEKENGYLYIIMPIKQ